MIQKSSVKKNYLYSVARRLQSRGRGGWDVVSRALWVRLWSEEESLQFNPQVPNLDGFYVRSFILGWAPKEDPGHSGRIMYPQYSPRRVAEGG